MINELIERLDDASVEAKMNAIGWVEVAKSPLWETVHLSADEDGWVCFEWWSRARKVTLYIGPDTVEYIKVDKAPELRMEDGSLMYIAELRELWMWLEATKAELRTEAKPA